jgi:hypothetical protein
MIGKRLATFVFAAVIAAAALVPAKIVSAATVFDGNWSLAVYTRHGPCDASYRFGGQIINGAIVYNGIGSVAVAGRVRPNGAVWLRVSSGAASAVASGRLRAQIGSGIWRGVSSSGQCTGTWTATRE